MTDRDAIEVDGFETELTLAVALEDAYTGEPPAGRARVELTNSGVEFQRTPSGYYVLVNLPSEPDPLEIAVESDRYLRETRSVPRSSIDASSPLETFELVPGPNYRFGGGVTLVRGLVEDGDEPVPGAEVSFVQGADETRSDANGEFALPIEDFGRDDVVTDEEGRRFVEPGGKKPEVTASHPTDGRTDDVEVTLPVGGTASVVFDF